MGKSWIFITLLLFIPIASFAADDNNAISDDVELEPGVEESTEAVTDLDLDKAEAGALEEAVADMDLEEPLEETLEEAYSEEESDKYKQEGLVFLKKYKSKEAIEAFEKAIELYPNNLKAYKYLSTAYSWDQDYGKAIETLEKLIKIAPDYEEAYSNMVLIYNLMGEYEKAISYGEEALKINPNSFGVMGYLVQNYIACGEYVKAVGCAEKLVENNPNRPRAHKILATAYDALGQPEKAREAFEKSYTMVRETTVYKDAPEKTKDMDALYNDMKAENLFKKGDEYLAAGDGGKGIECYKKYMEIKGDDHRAYYNIAKVYESEKDAENVIVNLKKAIKLNPDLFEQIMESDSFDFVKETPEFDKMLSEISGEETVFELDQEGVEETATEPTEESIVESQETEASAPPMDDASEETPAGDENSGKSVAEFIESLELD